MGSYWNYINNFNLYTMKYLNLFASHSQFVEPIDKPAVSYCEQENEVHYHPDPFNGHKYVDLGLPSGTLWAKCNIGANSETDYGLYFAWGETQGYANASTKAFSWNDYKWTEDEGATMLKYNTTDNKTELDLEDDAAHTNMGGDWHMPTGAQCRELFSETTNGFVTNVGTFTQYTWDNETGTSNPTEITVTINGWNTAGYFFFKSDVSDMNAAIVSGDYLFLPAAGCCYDGRVNVVGEYGFVWFLSLNTDYVSHAWNFLFNNVEAGAGGDFNRYSGLSVRGVIQGPVKYTYSIGFQTKDDNELFTSQSQNKIPTLSESTQLMALCALTYDNLQKVILTFEDGTVVSSEGKNPKNYIEWSSSQSLSLQNPRFTWQASIFPNNFNMPEQVKAQSVTIEVYMKE